MTRCPLRSERVRRTIRMVDYAVSELMRPAYDTVRGSLRPVRLRPDLQEVADSGVVGSGGRVYLRCCAPRRQAAAAAMDQVTAERWVNDVHLASPLPWSDPAWRPDVLAQGLLLARSVLPGFAALSPLPVQAVIGLQDAHGAADPGPGHAVGSLHVYQLAEPRDDARIRISAFTQPVLVITTVLA